MDVVVEGLHDLYRRDAYQVVLMEGDDIVHDTEYGSLSELITMVRWHLPYGVYRAHIIQQSTGIVREATIEKLCDIVYLTEQHVENGVDVTE